MFCILDLNFFFFDRFYDCLRDDMMLGIVCHLQVPSPFCLGNCLLHGIGHDIGIQYDTGIHIPCCPPDDLDQAPCITKETLFVCIKDADKSYFGDIKSFPQQVDPNKDIEFPEPEFADNFGAFESLYRVEGPGP